MTDPSTHNTPTDSNAVTADAPTAHPPASEPQRRSNRGLYIVLGLFLFVQCAFVGYAHWFVTRGLPNTLNNVSESDLLRDVRALTESSLRSLGSTGALPQLDPLLPPDPQAKNNAPDMTPPNGTPPNVAPNAPFLLPQDEVSVNDLLDIVESLSRDLDEQLRALEDPSYTPQPPGSQKDPLLPPSNGIAFNGDSPPAGTYL